MPDPRLDSTSLGAPSAGDSTVDSTGSLTGPSEEPSAAFRLRDVSVTIDGVRILANISCAAAHTERIALIGPSGAGKTTFLRVIAGAIEPTAGEATVLGQSLASLGGQARRRMHARIGFVHQSHSLVPMLRAIQNVAAGRLGSHGTLGGLRRALLPTRAEAAAIHETLERVGLGEHLYMRVDRLSGGEQQRVAIARTLYQKPDIWLADEPVASVDPARARALLELLVELCAVANAPLVASLHDVELARRYFPRIVGLKRGRVMFDSVADVNGQHEQIDELALTELYRIDDGS